MLPGQDEIKFVGGGACEVRTARHLQERTKDIGEAGSLTLGVWATGGGVCATGPCPKVREGRRELG